jgi:glycerate kinase
MRVMIALDSFKGTLSASEACRIVAEALLAIQPDAKVILKPMADGGEGTAQAMMTAMGGSWIPCEATSPVPSRRVQSGYAWFPETQTALVEMASASGLTLLRPTELNPLITTTRGTGELIQAAIARGARTILLALGGSATVDGGVGAAEAMGWRFLDCRGLPIPAGGGGLSNLAHIEPPTRMDWPHVEALTDVRNPLLGDQGAARIFGPQKGATPAMVETLEAGLQHLADVVRHDLGKEVAQVAGAGAAGGFGFGAMAFLNAALVSGIETIMRVTGLEEAMTGADWVITGEGSFDAQSLQGKVVSGILHLARRMNVRVAVIAGRIGLTKDEIKAESIDAAFSCLQDGMSLEHALTHSRELLREAAMACARVCLK